MPRIQVLHHNHDFRNSTNEAMGQQVITNVSFDGGAPEAVRLNLGENTSSLRRSSQPKKLGLLRNKKWFEIHNPSILVSFTQLSNLQNNFAVVHEALNHRARLCA